MSGTATRKLRREVRRAVAGYSIGWLAVTQRGLFGRLKWLLVGR